MTPDPTTIPFRGPDAEWVSREYAEELARAALRATKERNEAITLLRSTCDELDRWGWGDMHWSTNSPQEKSVVEAVAKVDAFLAGIGET